MQKQVLLALSALSMASTVGANSDVLVEVEAFDDLGGWVLDQQFMDLMGSPFLLAHGMGTPVADATTEVRFDVPGAVRVWVRTRDWVAPWNAKGAPGRFQLLVDGEPLGALFGIEGDPWHWQDGGTVTVGASARLALHDLTGFEGRCDAILFAHDGPRPTVVANSRSCAVHCSASPPSPSTPGPSTSSSSAAVSLERAPP